MNPDGTIEFRVLYKVRNIYHRFVNISLEDFFETQRGEIVDDLSAQMCVNVPKVM